jgi:hypothetical protein
MLAAEHKNLSIEGGIRGNQQRLVCPNCGKVFFAWRPDDVPGQKIKCYFCRFEFADEAAQRQPPAPIPAPSATAGEPASAPTPAPAEVPPTEPAS